MKRYKREAIRVGRRLDNGEVKVEPVDRYIRGAGSPRTAVCPGRNWKCDGGCGATLAREGLIRWTCPKAHFHRLCTTCDLQVFGPIGITNIVCTAGYLKRGMEIGPELKLSRCPFTITEADRAMAALILGRA